MHEFIPLGKQNFGQWKTWLLTVIAATLVACSSSGGDDGGGTNPNRAPTASAGGDQNVLETSFVQLAGSGSDPDTGDSLTYNWTQTAGTAVTLSNTGVASPSFNAPDVAPGNPEILTFRAKLLFILKRIKQTYVPPQIFNFYYHIIDSKLNFRNTGTKLAKLSWS